MSGNILHLFRSIGAARTADATGVRMAIARFCGTFWGGRRESKTSMAKLTLTMNILPADTYSAMPATKSHRFPPGKTLTEELCTAMRRIESYGVAYPAGYYRTLVEKYTREGVLYPHILMIIGEPRINKHFFYSRALKGTGRLLDYGCGTGDNVRQLIRDGFPRTRITAFDVNWVSIDLGFDLYRDRKEICDLFIVSGTFPFSPAEFDMVYSASVFHVIADSEEFGNYLANAYSALRPGGILFGSTLGLVEGAVRSPDERGPPRLMPGEQLAGHLTGAGFTRPEIVERSHVPHDVAFKSGNRCVFEFCTKKPA
jgi:SAM-dependent methyltransferase